MSIDVTQLNSSLLTNISALDDSSAENILLLAAAVNNVTENRILIAANVASLPSLIGNSAIPNGQMYYLEEENILVISYASSWVTLDGVLAREDFIVTDIYSAGSSSYGSLGIGSTFSTSSPTTILGGLRNWSTISNGNDHVLAINQKSGMFGWGTDNCGALGDGLGITGTTGGSGCNNSPISVGCGFSWSKVSAGRRRSLGITSSGVMYGWGDSLNAATGNGYTSGYRAVPTIVLGGITNWCSVSIPDSATFYPHTLAITTSNILYAWGYNCRGEIGNNCCGFGSRVDSPVTVIGGITNWCQASAGYEYSLAVTTTGCAYGWGCNANGQLGINSTVSRSSPVPLAGNISNWCQLSAGRDHSLGLTTCGILYSWGFNGGISNGGRLGNPSIASYASVSSPITVAGGITNWCSISASDRVSGGVTTNGLAYVWGHGGAQSAACCTAALSSPTLVVGGITTWTDIEVSNARSFLLSRP
jgi:alpha-tubulin suppressor-like RCC1 family protein